VDGSLVFWGKRKVFWLPRKRGELERVRGNDKRISDNNNIQPCRILEVLEETNLFIHEV
jgi:hypothetical protein